jgi:PAS domain S-box-containing protein
VKELKTLDVSKSTGRRLSSLYIIALSLVALLTIVGQVLIQKSINNQRTDSHVINLAGSQRYLSQQIVKFSLLLRYNVDHNDYKNKAIRLRQLIERWKKGHYGLQNSDVDLNLPGNNSEQIQRMFRKIDPYFQNIVNNAEAILSVSENKAEAGGLDKFVKVILANEDLFFKGMDAIVHQYAAEANEKVAFLKKVEAVLFSLTILVLILEGVFIFRPAVRKIKSTIEDLMISEARATNLTTRLKLLNHNLEKSLKDVKDISFAMDKATVLARTDRYGVITYVNDKFLSLLLYSRNDLIGRRFNVISSHYHSKAFFDSMWETISAGKIWNKEIQNRRKDGTYVWLDTTIVPVLDKSGTPESYIAIYTDVSSKFNQNLNEQKLKTAFILEGQEKERKIIARELHDGLGQMLTALKFNFEGIEVSGEENSKLKDIKKQIIDTIQETRRISFNLMPNVLNDYGLVPAVKHLIEQMSGHSKIKIIFECRWEQHRMGRNLEINLYRIIQEAMNNAIKYAEADEVKIEIDKILNFLRIEISDNGKGFSPGRADKSKITGSGNGIINIQERIASLNGDFRILSAPGEGTKILVKVPISDFVNESN